MIEEHREKWVREDELTYASQVDFDVALMQVVAVEEVSKKQGQQIEANLKLMHEQRETLDKRLDEVMA